MARKFLNAGRGENLFWRYGTLSAIGLRQIDLLSRPKDSALAGFHIAETVHSREAS
jgi:hypothetical protein